MAGFERPTKTGAFAPATTNFTPPDGGCALTFQLSDKAAPSTTTLWLGYNLGDAKGCYPSSFYEKSATFSPAQCPQSWTTGSTYTLGDGKTSGAVCCSTGYTLLPSPISLSPADNHDWCARVVTAPTVGILHIVESELEEFERKTVYPFTFGDGAKTALVRALHVQWHESDRSLLGLPPAETFKPSGTGGRTPEPEIVDPTGGGGGLSDTAKAGIGAGVGVLVVAIIVGVVFLFRRRRREARGEKQMIGEETMSGAVTGGRLAAGESVARSVVQERGQQTAAPPGNPPDGQRNDPLWSEYMARWAANQQDWAAYQADAQHHEVFGDGEPQPDDAHAGALPVDGRTPQDFARLEDATPGVKPPGFGDDHLDVFMDEKRRLSEESTLGPPSSRDEKN